MSIGSNINRIQLAKESIQKTLLKSGANVQGVIDNYEQPILDTPKRVLDLICKTVNNSNAKNVDLTMIDVSNVTSLYRAFRNNTTIENIDVSNWDTSKVTNLADIFSGCSSLVNIDVSKWNASNVVDFSGLFYGCQSLVNIDVSNWNTARVTSMIGIFWGCTSLTTLDISNWDLSKVDSMKNVLRACTSLETLKCDNLILPNIELGNIELQRSIKLSVDSIIGLLNALPQSDKGYSFQIGDVNIAKLSDEQKAIATNKGWTLI